jgi:Acyl-CoA synthetase (NDP forming)
MVALVQRQRHRQTHPCDAAPAQYRFGRRDRQAGNYAERIWNNLIKYQYKGGLYPVNAKRETIWGVPCYKDFLSLPDKPDHVLVLVPARLRCR